MSLMILIFSSNTHKYTCTLTQDKAFISAFIRNWSFHSVKGKHFDPVFLLVENKDTYWTLCYISKFSVMDHNLHILWKTRRYRSANSIRKYNLLAFCAYIFWTEINDCDFHWSLNTQCKVLPMLTLKGILYLYCWDNYILVLWTAFCGLCMT